MDIANIIPANPASAPNPSQPANTDRSVKAAPEQKPSTVVNISDEAKKLNETKNAAPSTAPTNAPENKAPQSREAAEAPGIQFMAGESKKGRVSTYA